MIVDTSNHIFGKDAQPCWHCGKRTFWLELSFEAPLHPGACSNAKWQEFSDAQTDVELVPLPPEAAVHRPPHGS